MVPVYARLRMNIATHVHIDVPYPQADVPPAP